MKRWVWAFFGAWGLGLLLMWLGFGTTPMKGDETLIEVVGTAVILLGFWLIDCTEIILAAIKEEASSHK
jgi:hypothetical protein